MLKNMFLECELYHLKTFEVYSQSELVATNVLVGHFVH
jgi:hypothetical protein